MHCKALKDKFWVKVDEILVSALPLIEHITDEEDDEDMSIVTPYIPDLL